MISLIGGKLFRKDILINQMCAGKSEIKEG